jgi:hypothetical protein
MTTTDVFLEMHNLLLPTSQSNPEPTLEEWKQSAIYSFYLIVGMVLAKGADIEEIREMLKEV